MPSAPPEAGGLGRGGSRLPDLFGTQTHEHLKAAFLRDAASLRLYLEFARLAEIEGHPEVAATLRQIAETVQGLASGHLDFLRRVGDPLSGMAVGETADNLVALRTATAQDLAENVGEYARTAHAEGFPDIASWFESVALTRQHHLVRLAESR